MERIVRFRYGGSVSYGVVEDNMIRRLAGDVPGQLAKTDGLFSPDAVQLLVPCVPSKIIGTGLNYRDVVLAPGERLPERPKLFLKAPTALVLSGQDVVQPPMVKELSCEVELGVVIGKAGKCIPQDAAYQYIWGYLVANDMTASDLQREDTLWARAKSFDTFLPVSAEIVTGIDPSALTLRSAINGQPAQSGSTADLICGIPWLISYISHVMTLLPGDLIITGTPSGYGKRVCAGDHMVMEIDGVGRLENRVVPFAGTYLF